MPISVIIDFNLYIFNQSVYILYNIIGFNGDCSVLRETSTQIFTKQYFNLIDLKAVKIIILMVEYINLV